MSIDELTRYEPSEGGMFRNNVSGEYVEYRDVKELLESIAALTVHSTTAAEIRAAALEEAAKLCDALESDLFDAYKGRGRYQPHNPQRADPYTNGESDGAGAGQCAYRIRALAGQQVAQGEKGGES